MTHEEFKIVWLPLSSGFLALARHMLDDESDAADAVQDLYVRLWNARDALDRVESPQAYGATMTRNICLDRLRRRQAHRAEGLEAVDGLLSLEGTDRRVISRESGEMLSRAMMKLPAKESELIRLRYFNELEYGEIAERTGLSLVNVRVSLMRAKRTLKKLIRYE